MTFLPRLLVAVGGMLLLLAIARAVFVLDVGGSMLELLIDFVLLAIPGAALLYTGFWMPVSEIDRRYYPRLIAWLLGGVVVMFGFIVLRDLHPGVTVEWTLGTQAIALTIGSIGGLLVGVQETRAAVQTDRLEQRTRKLEEYSERLERRERELERQNERLERFAGIVSHDLRNPLNVAQGWLDLAREEPDGEHLDRIAAAHERMEALIEDLLALAREGGTVGELRFVDLSDAAETCWATVATGDATLVARTDRTIRADPDRLRQLLENLFRNAVEHGGEDVTITVWDLDDGFYVEDDGPGIPADERGAVFEVGHSTAQGGTGFGLSIVERIADVHDWTVRLADDADGGARFEVTGVEFED